MLPMNVAISPGCLSQVLALCVPLGWQTSKPVHAQKYCSLELCGFALKDLFENVNKLEATQADRRQQAK